MISTAETNAAPAAENNTANNTGAVPAGQTAVPAQALPKQAKPAPKPDIRKATSEQIKAFMLANGEKAFRAAQVEEWLWQKSARSFHDMSSLHANTRKKLDEHWALNPVDIDTKQVSADGTVKSAFKLYDNNIVEGVLIPADDRMTACVSSQVGCSLTCKFCATGYMDRKRNLDAAEIYDQVVHIRNQAQEHFNRPLTNIVYMGMGEPLLNYNAVMESIERITSPQGLNMSPKRITVSTAGIAKMIKKLGDDEAKFNLAVSLHAADDVKRNQIMPINESNSLEALIGALKHWYRKTRSRVTLEYILFYDFNDTPEDARKLWQFTKQVPCKVNIIEYNPISAASFKNTGEDTLEAFKNYLEQRDVVVNVRRSRGKDIDAACGQLAGKNPPASPAQVAEAEAA